VVTQLSRWIVLLSGLALWVLVLAACSKSPWNNPYPAHEAGQNILYSSFSERPKHLDPVQSYSSNEYAILGQIYEPPLQYHYLKRPYTLEPLTAEAIPQPRYLDKHGKAVPETSNQVAYSVYEIHLKSGIRYQPHPALALDAQGRALYLALTPAELEQTQTLADFKQTGTRELTADDYVYQIKRLAHPKLHSPLLSFMGDYIVGLKEYPKTLREAYAAQLKSAATNRFLDLRKYPLQGAEVVDRYTYRITLHGKYPQFIYWLAMPFFAPFPAEADQFYQQAGMAERNIVPDWYPIGTGAYMLTRNDPNREMVLERNPNFHPDFYPQQGESSDVQLGYLNDAGMRLPFIDKIVLKLEKETIPYWNKFLQGYYDSSGIGSDSFDQAIQFGSQGDVQLTPELQAQGIQLATTVQPTIGYTGFNMFDDFIGGYTPAKQKLRQAISIAIDHEEYISIFRNGRGIAAQSPIPPDIFGHLDGKAGLNPYVYDWVNGTAKRKTIQQAKQLLAEAGYPNGRDPKTGEPLIIYLDYSSGGPEDKAVFDWFRKQLAKIDLQLSVRDTDYNRFQEKMRKGTAQMFMWGWNADYPDPENFLFLLYGPNAKAKHDGENAANYDNPQFNALFDKMKNMANSPQRLTIIQQLLEIARRDAPWLWGYYPKEFVLHHQWLYNAKPNHMAHNTLKYRRLDPQLREQKRREWNQARLWPVILLFGALMISLIPAIRAYQHKEHRAGIIREQDEA
jgi:oligopeptide transport system substrate-binding protein